MAEDTPHVLVVENDDDLRSEYGQWLVDEGYPVILSADALVGLEFTRMHRPGLIVMNLDLPGLDGWETIRILRRDPNLASIRIIALTHPAAKRRPRDGRSAGADAILQLPVHQDALGAMVHRLLPHHVHESLARVRVAEAPAADSARRWWAPGRKRA